MGMNPNKDCNTGIMVHQINTERSWRPQRRTRVQEPGKAPFLKHSRMMRSAVMIQINATGVSHHGRVNMLTNQIQCPKLVCMGCNDAMRR